jgi:hypothetical protein
VATVEATALLVTLEDSKQAVAVVEQEVVARVVVRLVILLILLTM